MKSTIFAFLLLSFGVQAFAKPQTMFSETEKFSSLLDSVGSEKVFVFYPNEGGLDVAKIFNLKSSKFDSDKSFAVDSDCKSLLQSMSVIYAHPLVANAKIACLIDESNSTLTLIENQNPPSSHFAFVYSHTKDSKMYFFMNGKPFPSNEGDFGYVNLITIDIEGEYYRNQRLISRVTGASGAMTVDHQSNQLFYIKSTPEINSLYSFPLSELLGYARMGREVSFDQIAVKPLINFSGYSFELYVTELFYFIYNKNIWGNFNSITLTIPNGERGLRPVPDECDLTGRAENKGKMGWVYQCAGKGLFWNRALRFR